MIEDCLIEASRMPRTRQQHGKAIARHQLVQEHIAAIEMDRAATEALVYRRRRGQGRERRRPGRRRAAPRRPICWRPRPSSTPRSAAWDAADRAVQIFGGRGWSDAYRPGRHLQDVRVCRIYEGTDEILKLKIAAAVLGKEYEAFK